MMPSLSSYHLTWVSLTLDVAYLLTATPPDLELGVAPLSLPAPVQPPLLRHGVALLGRGLAPHGLSCDCFVNVYIITLFVIFTF